MKRRRRLVTIVSLLPAFLGLTVTVAPAASAATPTFTVMNTSETLPDGVYFRNSPHTSDTSRITGLGVYKNERVQLQCYAWGDTVGRYGNKLWYKVKNLTRPTTGGRANAGYLNAHYVNDGTSANVVSTGVVKCGSAPAIVGYSAFYSPNNTPNAIAGTALADRNLALGAWSSGDCGASKASSSLPLGVTTLSGWSKGRLGPIYFLASAGASRVSQVRAIILFDPGSSSDFAPPPYWQTLPPFNKTTCDWRYPINSLLANWLKSNSANRLIVFTGRDSEESKNGKPTFAGLWKYYFAGLWNQSFASRAMICDYYNVDHSSMLTQFAGAVRTLPASCPVRAGLPKPIQWHP